MDYSAMTIAEIEGAIISNQGEQQALKAVQQTMHDAAEAKRRAIPIAGVGTVMLPGGIDMLGVMRSLPSAERQALLKQLNDEESK